MLQTCGRGVEGGLFEFYKNEMIVDDRSTGRCN